MPNVLSGNLDREGGAMFPLAAAGHSNAASTPGRGRGVRFGRWQSRVRGAGEIFGELSAACLAEEIETRGEGQIRALLTFCGNPVLSTPNSGRLDRALSQLEFMVNVDAYVNETTRHADVILPAPSPLGRSHYDLALCQFVIRNVANYSPPSLPPDPELPEESIIMLRLAAIAAGLGPEGRQRGLRRAGRPNPDQPRTPDLGVDRLRPPRGQAAGRAGAPRRARAPARPAAAHWPGPTATASASARTTSAWPRSRRRRTGSIWVRCNLGSRTCCGRRAGRSSSPRRRSSPTSTACAPPSTRRLRRNAGRCCFRRQLRSNNSWMHNLPMLVRGKARCTLHVHPDDAALYGLSDGAPAVVTSRTGTLAAEVEVTDAIMPGVVSLPHGWGHDVAGTNTRIAAAHASVNSNLLADELQLDVLSGNAVLNGSPCAWRRRPPISTCARTRSPRTPRRRKRR